MQQLGAVWQLHPSSAGISYFRTPTAFDVFSFSDFIILGLHNASLLRPWVFFFSVLQGGQYGPVHLLLGHLFLSTGGCPFNFCLCFVQLSVSALGSVFLVYLGFIPLFPVWSTRIASRSATHLSFWIPFLNSVSIKLYICTHVGIAFVGTSKKTLLLKVIIFFSCSLIKLSRVQWPSFLLHAVLSYFFACVWNIDRNCEPVSKHFSVIRWWIQPAFPIRIAFEYLSKIGSPY